MEIRGSATIVHLPIRDVLATGRNGVESGAAQRQRATSLDSPLNSASVSASVIVSATSSATSFSTLSAASSATPQTETQTDLAARQASEDRAASQTPFNEPAPNAGLRFEFEDKTKTQIMKVNDQKGILIYQVPSKGQLTLIEAQDSIETERLVQMA